MFCRYCGTRLPDHASFCTNCGKSLAESAHPQAGGMADGDGFRKSAMSGEVLAGAGAPVDIGAATPGAAMERADGAPGAAMERSGTVQEADGQPGTAVPEHAKGNEPVSERKDELCDSEVGLGEQGGVQVGKAKDKLLAMAAALKNDKRLLMKAGIVAAALVVAMICWNKAIANGKIGKLEEEIDKIASSASYDEDEVLELYGRYDALSSSDKRKVENRDALISAYKQIETWVEERRQAAGQVEAMIASIDHSNRYAEADSVKAVVIAYNGLDEKAKEYVESYGELEKIYEAAKDLDVAVTAENFYDLFAIEYKVGEKTNYGEGFKVDLASMKASVHNNFATPVYITISSRYQNLTSSCNFYINLHQTYTGLGLLDNKDIHEYNLQSGTIQYDSSRGRVEYVIHVQNKDSSKGAFVDLNDMSHEMNAFDASLVEIANIDGSVKY